MKERLVERNKPITEPIKKNNFPTFNVLSKKVVSKDKAKVGVLKQDLALFSRLYISCQTRDGKEEGRKQILSNACQIAPTSAPYNQLLMLPFLMEPSSFKC